MTNTHRCDWCGATMQQIVDHGSWMCSENYALWLCNNPACGHEKEYLKPASAERILRSRGFK